MLFSEPHKTPMLVLRCNVFRPREEAECESALGEEVMTLGWILKPRDPVCHVTSSEGWLFVREGQKSKSLPLGV